MAEIKNLGIIAAIFVGASAPSNTVLIWYNTNDDTHYIYRGGVWIPAFESAESSVNVDDSNRNVQFSEGNNVFYHTLGTNRFSVTIQKSVDGSEVMGFGIVEKTDTTLTLYSALSEDVDYDITLIGKRLAAATTTTTTTTTATTLTTLPM